MALALADSFSRSARLDYQSDRGAQQTARSDTRADRAVHRFVARAHEVGRQNAVLRREPLFFRVASVFHLEPVHETRREAPHFFVYDQIDHGALRLKLASKA
jgi:hypothetical protein